MSSLSPACCELYGLNPDDCHKLTISKEQKLFLEKARLTHPDKKGGSKDKFQKINGCHDEYKKKGVEAQASPVQVKANAVWATAQLFRHEFKNALHKHANNLEATMSSLRAVEKALERLIRNFNNLSVKALEEICNTCVEGIQDNSTPEDFVAKLTRCCVTKIGKKTSLRSFCGSLEIFSITCEIATKNGDLREAFVSAVISVVSIAGAVAGALTGAAAGALFFPAFIAYHSPDTIASMVAPKAVCSGSTLLHGGTCGIGSTGLLPAVKLLVATGAVIGSVLGGAHLYETTRTRMKHALKGSLHDALKEINA